MMKQNKLFLAYFDTLGFECIIDLSGQDKKEMWAVLSDKPAPKLPVHQMIMRAKANPQRFPEIYTFWSMIELGDLIAYSNDMPQQLADLIREKGEPVFVTPKQKEVIK